MEIFTIGERVIYPNHGVGVIEKVSKHSISGQPEEFYQLRIQSTNSVVMVPTANVQSVGLRRVIDKSDVDQLLRILRTGFTQPQWDWKNRFKENSDRMRSGSILQVAEVLKNLLYISCQKQLSFRERRMLERARQLVIGELAIATGQSEEKTEGLLDKALTLALERAGIRGSA